MNIRISRRKWMSAATALGLASTYAIWWFGLRQGSAPKPNSELEAPRIKPSEIFERHVVPVLTANSTNQTAIRVRCSDRIREQFAGYRKGIDPFIEDISSTWTRLGILKRMPMDWWNEDDRVEKYVVEKFEQHLFSEGDLNQGITDALLAFKADLLADQAQLLSRVKVAVSESELPEIQIPSYLEFDREVRESLGEFAARSATNSVKQGLASLISSEIATAIAAGLVTRVVASIGASAATSAGAAGGATASGAAAGAGTGSLGGPVGTAIGLGVGLVLGIAVDWWMTERFRSQLRMELNTYLFRLETGILVGEHGDDGLESELESLILQLQSVQRNTLESKITGTKL